MGKKKEKLEVVAEAEAEADVDERGKWSNPAEFTLSCLGYAVGLGNVWRFPYLAYTNGGGAFLIPYAIMLTFVGLPIFFIELSVGQFIGGGPITVWAASPLFLGVGVGMLIISFIGCIYYNMIIAWSLYYMFASWQKVLPWSVCSNEYNSAYCYSRTEELNLCPGVDNSESIWFNQTCHNRTTLNSFQLIDLTLKIDDRVSASEEYFNFGMLNRSDKIEDSGELQWKLVLTLLLAWILCYVCVIRGIKSSGKVVYFTATFPYLIIFVLLIRGALLEGSLEGIKFYIIPKWDQLLKPKVWADAAGQIFFSLSVGMGGLMTFASYNKFHNNVYRDTMIVAIGNCVTSFIAGFAIFSILGHLAFILKKDVSEVAQSGSGLAFIAYPEVVMWLEPPQLWASLFFFMLLTLGLDSQFAGIENLMTAFLDVLPRYRKYKPIVALVLCVILFLLGLTMCTRGGVYWVELMSYYSSGWSLVLIGMAEIMAFAWVYSPDWSRVCARYMRVKEDIEYMIGFKLYWHWWICWTFITPVLLIAILVFNIIETTPLAYGEYVLPEWAQGVGWLMAVASVGMVPIFAVVQTCRSYSDPDYRGLPLHKRLRKLTRPNKDWIPSIEKDRRLKEARGGNIASASNGIPSDPESKGGPPPYSAVNLAYVHSDTDNTYL